MYPDVSWILQNTMISDTSWRHPLVLAVAQETLQRMEVFRPPICMLQSHNSSDLFRKCYIWACCGWWKKSCTSWYGKHPIIYKVLNIPGGCLGFLNHQYFPSTRAHFFTCQKSFNSKSIFDPKVRVPQGIGKSFFLQFFHGNLSYPPQSYPPRNSRPC